MPATTDALSAQLSQSNAVSADRAADGRMMLLWLSVHCAPLLLVPLLTTTLGPSIGLDSAAALTHATVMTFVPLAEAALLRRVWLIDAAWRWRAVLAMVAAIATAMIVMPSVDLAGYDALATPGAMTAAGVVHGVILGWPLRRVGARRRWVAASALGWLVGAGAYRLLLSDLLALRVGSHSLYGYAYTGGHNELLWTAMGIACFGIATALVILRAPRRASQP